MSNNTETVQMTAEERKEYEAFRAEKDRKAAAKRLRQDRKAYKQLVSEMVDVQFPKLERLSKELAEAKAEVYSSFRDIIDMKKELYEKVSDNKSHTFINKEMNARITFGNYEIDSYDDTVNEGIAMAKARIEDSVDSKKSEVLVKTLLMYLTRDKKGNLRPSYVVRLRQMAIDLDDQKLLEAIGIIEAAYHPQLSKLYVRAEKKNEQGEWVNVPLGMTES